MRVWSRVAASVTLPGGDWNPGPLGLEPPNLVSPLHWAPRGRRAGRQRLGSSAPSPAPDSAREPNLDLRPVRWAWFTYSFLVLTFS